ncbi:MAG: hypothetical protein IT258_23475 [Saprospiraceae bacterium]|nr:hypothetical protein [Saprospiraceae bacterium]
MKSFLRFFIAAAAFCLGLAACSSEPKDAASNAPANEAAAAPAPAQDTTAPSNDPLVGADKDKHDCKGSAGYQWSSLMNDCVRLFEVGVPLQAKADGLDQTLAAYIIFREMGAEAYAEVFIPRHAKPYLLKKEAEGKWRGKTHIITEGNGMYTLDNAAGKLLYQGAVKK